MGHARALLTLTEILQLETAETIVAKGLSVRETEELVRKIQIPANLMPSLAKPVESRLKAYRARFNT